MHQDQPDPQRHQHRHPHTGGRNQAKRRPRVKNAHDRARERDGAPTQHGPPDAPCKPSHPFPARPECCADWTSLEQENRHDKERANIRDRDGPEQSGTQRDADRRRRKERRRLFGKVIINVMPPQQQDVRQTRQPKERPKTTRMR